MTTINKDRHTLQADQRLSQQIYVWGPIVLLY